VVRANPLTGPSNLHKLTLRMLYLRPGLIAKVLAIVAFFTIGIV
jgi:hypothetical protein